MIKNRFEIAKENHVLDKFDKEKLKATKRKTATFIKIYNKLCKECRQKTFRVVSGGGAMEFEQYCNKCQRMIKEFER